MTRERDLPELKMIGSRRASCDVLVELMATARRRLGVRLRRKLASASPVSGADWEALKARLLRDRDALVSAGGAVESAKAELAEILPRKDDTVGAMWHGYQKFRSIVPIAGESAVRLLRFPKKAPTRPSEVCKLLRELASRLASRRFRRAVRPPGYVEFDPEPQITELRSLAQGAEEVLDQTAAVRSRLTLLQLERDAEMAAFDATATCIAGLLIALFAYAEMDSEVRRLRQALRKCGARSYGPRGRPALAASG